MASSESSSGRACDHGLEKRGRDGNGFATRAVGWFPRRFHRLLMLVSPVGSAMSNLFLVIGFEIAVSVCQWVWFGSRGFYASRDGRSGGESFHEVKIEKHFHEKFAELQIPPLRYASVPRQAGTGGMTHLLSVRKGKENECFQYVQVRRTLSSTECEYSTHFRVSGVFRLVKSGIS
jgi:hypothetical protein